MVLATFGAGGAYRWPGMFVVGYGICVAAIFAFSIMGIVMTCTRKSKGVVAGRYRTSGVEVGDTEEGSEKSAEVCPRTYTPRPSIHPSTQTYGRATHLALRSLVGWLVGRLVGWLAAALRRSPVVGYSVRTRPMLLHAR